MSRSAREAESPCRCSVHTHTTLCDGKGAPAEMAAAAYRAGVRHFGFSGHSHTPNPADQGYTLPADTADYRRAVLREREAYAGRMEILLGIEWDLLSGGPPEGYDYWIGSVHLLRTPEGGYYAVDAHPETFAACRDRVFGGDPIAMAEAYYREVERMAAMRPTILGHFDLITKYNEGGALFDEDDPRCRRAALEALHALDPAATLLEINTGAMSRGYRTAPYPAPSLLREWRSMGGRVILTADAHSPETILYGYALAAEAAREAGYRACAILTAEGVRECPL